MAHPSDGPLKRVIRGIHRRSLWQVLGIYLVASWAVLGGVDTLVAGLAMRQVRVEAAHFHHVHLNVTDRQETIDFYEKYFGANPVSYRDRSAALFTEKSFILLNDVAEAPPSHQSSSVWHIGWAGVDGPSEFAWRTAEGIDVHTPLTPLGANHYMYFYGPDREVIEVYTGSRNHRFEHVHLIVTDIDETLAWFREYLGLEPVRPAPARTGGRFRSTTIRVDNVNVIIFDLGSGPLPNIYPPEIADGFGPTDGTAIDHIAFSYTELDPVFERMSAAGEVVRGIEEREEYGFRSFFVRTPDGVLVEVVEEHPIPEGIWR